MSRTLSILLYLAVFILTGCATAPPERLYTPPENVAASVMAQVVGSHTKRSWPVDNEVVWVDGVDGAPTRAGHPRARRSEYAQPIQLAPGTRTLWIVFSQGKLFIEVPVTINVKPGQSIVVKGQTHDMGYLEKISGKDFVVLWVEDAATGELLSERTRAGLSY